VKNTAGSIEKIFDPFHTTKPGEGLGLSIVHTIIVEQHQQIKVETETGAFTEFTLILPKI